MAKGGMCGEGEACVVKGACMAKGGPAWQKGGMHGEGGMCMVKGGHAWYEIWPVIVQAVHILLECILV